MKYIFHPEAINEYSESVKFYKQQSRKTAQSFIDSVEEAIYKIREFPTRYPQIDKDIHRCLTLKFPYAVLYTIESDYILILAVMHCHRDPNYWKSRF